jgi:NADP-dependent 3-hydroxy acid dehydrogenase YdfG
VPVRHHPIRAVVTRASSGIGLAITAALLARGDQLVNNEGVFIARPLSDYTAADLDALVDTNLRGFVYPTQRAARHMAADGGGHVVSVTASIARPSRARW